MTPTLELQLEDFAYDDLYVAERLPRLDRAFLDHLHSQTPDLAQRLRAYRAAAAGDGDERASELLIDAARHLEDFLVTVFGVRDARDALRANVHGDTVVHAFKKDFVRKCLGGRAAVEASGFAQLDGRLDSLLGDSGCGDRELAVARFWQLAERDARAADLQLLRDWVQAAVATEAGRKATGDWVSLQLPRRTDYNRLVAVQTPVDASRIGLEGPAEQRRHRDGFGLTDTRAGRRQALDQVHYCKYCHSHEGDFCSRGFPGKGEEIVRSNPLGVALGGCPLKEKISEANVLEREGYSLAALAVIMIDNPLVPATGHRICNDCMKSCIYQKQEPVNVPQIETRILSDVLALPWGYEIYYCLTRWNPLNREHPYARPYHGVNVLCVGTGPAGFNLTHHLLQAGFGVVAIDGLKVEPLPERWTGTPSRAPQPIERVEELQESLDRRVMAGFGGVAEYGITVRWDKNFLKIVYLTLARNRRFRVYGGIRFGGTLTIDDAWGYGFDHIALATGAGKPTVVPVKNKLAHGIRQASDFLMALQLTGAAKESSLANLQVRLPALVVGGGLTAIDTATEVQAYYVRQVEKLLARFETLGADAVQALLGEHEQAIVDEYIDHGRQVRAERERAAAAGDAPDFAGLVRRWGGVTVAYRRRMQDSPAYLRNHEEIDKALQEGIFYAENLSPTEAVLDGQGHVQGMRFVLTSDAGAGSDTMVLAARSVFMAAGSVPNTAYEREHPGTFQMQGRFYAAFTDDGTPVGSEPDSQGERADAGFFTSYRNGTRRISFFGDNHPRYSGSVVRAMASGRDGARKIVALFGSRIDAAGTATSSLNIHRWDELVRQLDDRLRPCVVALQRLGGRLMSITVRAPQATRNWAPGQVYRLQNFETLAERRSDTLLQMEGMAVDGVQVDRERGEVKLLVNEVGASSRIAARLRPGEPVVLMGPTGTGLPMPAHKTVTVVGGHSAVTSMVDGSHAWRAAGNRTILVGHFADRDRAQAMQELIHSAADQVVWVLDSGPALHYVRPQDTCFAGGLDAFFDGLATFAGPAGAWLRETDELIISDKPEAMACIVGALKSDLSGLLKPGVKGTAVVNSPMQCMLKEVCAQCLCQHHGADASGSSKVVFSCFNQHQPLFDVDFDNLRVRQGQNSVQEKISALWLSHILDTDDPPVQRIPVPLSAKAG